MFFFKSFVDCMLILIRIGSVGVPSSKSLFLSWFEQNCLDAHPFLHSENVPLRFIFRVLSEISSNQCGEKKGYTCVRLGETKPCMNAV